MRQCMLQLWLSARSSLGRRQGAALVGAGQLLQPWWALQGSSKAPEAKESGVKRGERGCARGTTILSERRARVRGKKDEAVQKARGGNWCRG